LAVFLHHCISKYTWTSPEGWNTQNQIDHILIDKHRDSGVLDVRSFRAADCDAADCLVVAKVGDRLAVNKQIAQMSYGEVQSQEVKRGRE
jgi:hypothetical protein